MITLTVERTIPAAPEAVFDWLADPRHYVAAPLILRIRPTRDGTNEPLGVGAQREVTVLGAWFREEITGFERPREQRYLIVKSFPGLEHDGGSIVVAPVAGGSHVTWTTRFAVAPRWGGAVVARLFAPPLRWSFAVILEAAEQALTTGAPTAAAHAPFAFQNRVVNPGATAILRSRLHPLLSGSLTLVTVTGRKTGREYTFPVLYELDGDRVTIDVAWPQRKRWWRNLRGGAPIGLVLRGAERTGHADVHEDDDGRVCVEVRLDPAGPA